MKTKMKGLTALLLTATLVACAGKMQEAPIHERITGTYVLAYRASPLTKNYAAQVLKARSEEVCPAGYAIISSKLLETSPNTGAGSEARELVWQIRCNPQQQPTTLSF